MRPPRFLLPFLTSATLHAALVVAQPFSWPERPAFVPPVVEEEAMALGPVNVGVYEEPAPEVAPPPPPPPPPIAELPKVDADLPKPPEQTAESDVEGKPAEQVAKVEKKKREPKRSPKKSNRKPCPEPTQEIARTGSDSWTVERDLVEYYASHLKELMKLASVSPHEAGGKPDGFRVGLPRCSILRDGGLRSGDVVHDINGRKVNNVVQAVAAYFALRKEKTLTVRLTRQGKQVAQTYHIEGDAGRPAKIRLKDLK
ncbi:MAG: hypothetical protein ACOZNI_31890 [Myxococcota bacterium]